VACTIKAEVATGSTVEAFKSAVRDSLSQQKAEIPMTLIQASAVQRITTVYLFPCIAVMPLALGILEQNNFRQPWITDL
jgi:hypothetical protein